MKILLGYSYYEYPVDVKTLVEQKIHRLRRTGLEIEAVPLTLTPPGPRLSWPELDERWAKRDRELLSMYDYLEEKMESFDVLVNWNGINLHPEFVEKQKKTTVFCCFDDPESSADLSKPVAKAYDLCLVGNVAELDAYRSWGVKEVRFWPLGFTASEYDPVLTYEQIMTEDRPVDVSLLSERVQGIKSGREERMDRYVSAFPQGAYYGRGWPNGFLPEEEKVPLYQRTKIGPNFHHSTGPINYRTYILPANGVMQICDNKAHLAKVYDLGTEVVGFDTVDEAIELTKYYLSHDDERRLIAANGWKRAICDYSEEAVYKLMVKYIEEVMSKHRNQTLASRIKNLLIS